MVRHVVERLQETGLKKSSWWPVMKLTDRAVHGLLAPAGRQPRPDEGLSESLRVGLHAAPAAAAAFLIALDQRLVEPFVIELMIAAWRGGSSMIAPRNTMANAAIRSCSTAATAPS
ncbi:MAG: NTP transferase domain-containing protein [Gemmatimonadaceae bacterium]